MLPLWIEAANFTFPRKARCVEIALREAQRLRLSVTAIEASPAVSLHAEAGSVLFSVSAYCNPFGSPVNRRKLNLHFFPILFMHTKFRKQIRCQISKGKLSASPVLRSFTV
jgi:hypothetical protein